MTNTIRIYSSPALLWDSWHVDINHQRVGKVSVSDRKPVVLNMLQGHPAEETHSLHKSVRYWDYTSLTGGESFQFSSMDENVEKTLHDILIKGKRHHIDVCEAHP